jgi:hypothetical protein
MSKKKNPSEETADEVPLAETQVKSLVEPIGKCQKKNPWIPGLSLEKHPAIPPR